MIGRLTMRCVWVSVLVMISSCANRPGNTAPPDAPPSPPPPPPSTPSLADAAVQSNPTAVEVPVRAHELHEVFPFVRVDATRGMMEFDATVCINVRDPKTPRVYLEVLACIPDTKEHESLVVTRALPSHVHAALLLAGLTPGTPGTWDWEGATIRPVPPTGPRVRVTAVYGHGDHEHVESLTDWVVDVNDGRTMTASAGADHFVFAGSQMLERRGVSRYRADGEGCVVGLATFGGETIAWTRLFNPDASLEEPRWIAEPAKVPEFGTPVVVRIERE
ncbi:MAG: hypothetical protein HBSAPP03_04380 [Phycisphaerae bacterium]|nr:MAG: hypothetical protein HBSAPP03_04380 [Phycisphaerae bacterium]